MLLGLLTLGIYHWVVIYRCYSEMRAYRGSGISGGVGLLLFFVMPFLFPSQVKACYRANGWQSPVSGWSGLWMCLPICPFVGILVWMFTVHGALNNFWSMNEAVRYRV